MKFLFFLMLFFFSVQCHAQMVLFHHSEKEKLNKELEIVENLIQHKIDSLRAKKKLGNLKENQYLTKAAKLHADWMNETGKFSHSQNKSKTKTPQKRVEFVGGKDTFIGENIAYTLYDTELTNLKGKEYVNESYEAIAEDLVEMWRHSKGHYKNIMTKEFRTTGITRTVDFKTQTIYAVQVFGGE